MAGQRRKCLICGLRPRMAESRYCQPCGSQIDAETRSKKPEKPFMYLHWKGSVVGMFPVNGDGTYRPRLLHMELKRVPKRNLVNLDRYCPGYTREQIKKLKLAVRTVTGV